jgi:hypothetical protein
VTAESTAPIAGQQSAIRMLADLATLYPELPAAYTTIRMPWQGGPSELDLQLHTPSDFEQWRVALAIDPAGVNLHPNGRGSWVAVETVRGSIRIGISAHGILLTEDQLSAPRGSEVSA